MTWLAAPGRAQLALTAALSGTLVAGTILTLQTLRRDKEMSDLKSSIPRSAQQDPIANKVRIAPGVPLRLREIKV